MFWPRFCELRLILRVSVGIPSLTYSIQVQVYWFVNYNCVERYFPQRTSRWTLLSSKHLERFLRAFKPLTILGQMLFLCLALVDKHDPIQMGLADLLNNLNHPEMRADAVSMKLISLLLIFFHTVPTPACVGTCVILTIVLLNSTLHWLAQIESGPRSLRSYQIQYMSFELSNELFSPVLTPLLIFLSNAFCVLLIYSTIRLTHVLQPPGSFYLPMTLLVYVSLLSFTLPKLSALPTASKRIKHRWMESSRSRKPYAYKSDRALRTIGVRIGFFGMFGKKTMIIYVAEMITMTMNCLLTFWMLYWSLLEYLKLIIQFFAWTISV